jgi:hypothetical protein
MATTITIGTWKRALLDEIQNLAIASATAASPTSVQVTYARPPLDELRRESVYFSSDMRTLEDTEYRLNSGRRKRYNVWDVDIMVSTEIISDPENAEQRNLVIVAAIESFVADYQPPDYPNFPVASGTMTAAVMGYEVEHTDTSEGFRLVETTINLEVKERLI